MSGWVLLVIGLASLGLVAFAFGYVGYTGYKLVKAGLRSRALTASRPPTSPKGRAAQQPVGQAGTDAQEIAASLARLQANLQRLQVAFEALRDALVPYQKLRTYFGR